jgi:hypothetical protein
VAGFFGFRSFEQLKDEINTLTKTEVQKAQSELQGMRSSVQVTTDELKSTSKRKLDNVRVEVQKRVNDEFKSENITALVASAAKERTEKELSGIIRSETAAQVTKGLQEQQPFIKATVESQTKEVVNTLEPSITAVLSKATHDEVANSVAPISSQLTAYGNLIKIGTLATLAKNDDRKSYDALRDIWRGITPASTDEKQVADMTVMSIAREQYLRPVSDQRFPTPKTPQELKQLLSSTLANERIAALFQYPRTDHSLLPTVLQMINADQSIDVVVAAIRRLNSETGQRFNFPNYDEINAWWSANKAHFGN